MCNMVRRRFSARAFSAGRSALPGGWLRCRHRLCSRINQVRDRPARAHGRDTSCPRLDSVMKAVRRSGAAKAEVGGIGVGQIYPLDQRAIRGDHHDAADPQARDGDVAAGLDRKGIVALEPGQSCDQIASGRRRPACAPQHTRCRHRVRPQPPRRGFRHIKRAAVRRQANAVWPDQGKR